MVRSSFWALEVYHYQVNYIMFASFKAENQCRGTQVLSADHPLGSFTPIYPRTSYSTRLKVLRWDFIDEEETLFAESGGHGMLFETFEKQPMLTIYAPIKFSNERPVFYPVKEENGLLVINRE